MNPTRCRVVTVVLALFFSLASSVQIVEAQQTASIKGIVRSASGEPVAEAEIEARGTEIRTKSGFDGSYELLGVPVVDGALVLVARHPDFDRRTTILNTVVGSEIEKDIVFSAREEEDDSRTIISKGVLDATSEKQTLTERINSAVTGDVMGAEQMKKSVISNAGDAVSKLPAVSIQDGRFAFVRGLGERYSQTLVNGATLPSPEPDKRVLPLDLFPANLLAGITVTKTYSPELPGEFAGGSIQIKTIDIPEDRFLNVSFSTKYGEGTTLRDFRTYEGGNRDVFTFDDGTRELPDAVPGFRVPSGASFSDAVEAIGDSFRETWQTHNMTAAPDHKIGVSYGNRFEVGPGTLGVVAAGNWSNKYDATEGELYRVLQNQGAAGIGVRSQFHNDTYKFKAELSTLVNLTYELSQGQRVGMRNLLARSADDRVRRQVGYKDSDPTFQLQVESLRWVERMIYNGQLWGEHLLVGDALVTWRTSYSVTERDEPDNRQVRYTNETGEFRLEDKTGSGSRDFYYLDEDVYDYSIDLAIPFRPFVGDVDPDPDEIVPQQKVQIGASYVTRDRSFDGRRFRFRAVGGAVDENGDLIDQTLPPDDIFTDENINDNGIVIQEDTRSTDSYAAEQTLMAAYLMTDFRVHRYTRVQGGLRVESSEQEVETFALFGVPPDIVRAELDDTDWLPALNIVQEVPNELTGDVPGRNMQFRLGLSQTVSRPEFRELAEFQFTDVAEGYAARGNPNLERATIQHVDLRWEWLFNSGDLLSVSSFIKKFDDPIERVIIPTGSALITTWENAKSGELYGFEFEARKNLSFLSPSLESFSINCNYAMIESEVSIDPNNTTAVQTNDKRNLQGQPEYTLNFGLRYDGKLNGISAGIFVSSFGETISAVGAFGVPDEIQQPRFDLDFTISKKLDSSTVRFTIENILDERFEYKQGSTTTRKYKKGISAGVSYSMSF